MTIKVDHMKSRVCNKNKDLRVQKIFIECTEMNKFYCRDSQDTTKVN